jgi:hypothetical protein
LSGVPDEGLNATGPCLFELPESTLLLPPGWSARVDSFGSVVARADTPNPDGPSLGVEGK